MKHPETARRLREALDAVGLIPQELSDRSGVSKASLSQYLNGSHKPSNISAGKMAPYLNVNPLWLMGFDKDNLSDADRFSMFADDFNEKHTYFLTGRIEAHMKDYQKLNDAFKDRIDSLTKALLSAQEAEEDLLLAAHVRTDITPTDEDKLHDISIMKQMRDEN